MWLGEESERFGREKDDSFKCSIGATMFLYFLDKNKALFCDGRKRIADSTLVALTIMIEEFREKEKEMMVSV